MQRLLLASSNRWLQATRCGVARCAAFSNAATTAYSSPAEGFDRSGPMWAEQKQVERLPLPPLDDTLRRYIEHLRPLVSDADLHNARVLADEFGAGEGRALQAELQYIDAESIAGEGSYGTN